MLRRHGYGPLPVHFLGKAATFNLLYAFPLLLARAARATALLAEVFRPFGLGVRDLGDRALLVGRRLYVVQVRQLVAADARRADRARRPCATGRSGAS